MSAETHQVILWIVAGAALVRSGGILLLKIRQRHYLDRAVAAPKGWRNHCTEPEPPLLGVVALILLYSQDASAPSPAGAALAVVGLLSASAGWLLISWAAKSFPAVSPGHYVLPEQQIVRAGPYGHIRNPLYAGAILVWLGLGAAFESQVVLAITLLYVLPGYLIYIRSEEEMLLRHFGGSYDRYRRDVGMLFPRLRAWRGSASD
jgi:protein-S-isoprenylcysteine O-methyltransferase Ste14